MINDQNKEEFEKSAIKI